MVPIIISCELDPLQQDEIPSFDKLYAVSENVEAIDFICKPNQSGYIILGNIKTSENSDIILIDVAPDGIQREFYRINTPFFDEGVKLKVNQDDNSLIILGHRRTEATQANVNQNFIIKTNIDGIPIRAENASDEDPVIAEIKLFPEDPNEIVQLNDMVLIPPHLITVGFVRESTSGRFNRITRIYNWNTINFSDTSDVDIDKTVEIPIVNDINYNNNSRSLRVLKGNTTNGIYSVYGQINKENPNGEIAGNSLNINWNIYTDIQSSAPEPINDIGSDKNEELGSILHHSNGKTYLAGNYTNNDDESLFLITKEYRGIENNTEQKIYPFGGKGTKVTSLTEDIDNNIIMATIEEEELSNISYLLKFSPAGEPIEDQEFEFNSTGLYHIKKIESEPNNVIVVLSQKSFENNSTAIGLMKIKF
ncbi:hypothetical protein [Marivirga sp.]|uniref:hypothetical protein n=1 Tax=Marivirga sp. TaxID=2018662 RepID=UPI002D7E47CF|nr:hypothetical protein [Marivirga sp.]HET8859750.1 hypothetical protein [Marivirga sp.]